MALFTETTVPLYYAEGLPGRIANENPHVYTTLNYVAGAPVQIASFVWLNTDDSPRAVNTGTGQPLGFVIALYDYYLTSRTERATYTAEENDRLTIMRAGDVWAQSADPVTVGQKVFANLTTGAVTTGDAGATVAGAVETTWVVKYVSPDSGNLFIMSNLDPVMAAAPATP